MANVTSYLILLFFFIFNMLVMTTNGMGIWDNSMQGYNLDGFNDDISSGITELTDVGELEAGDDISIDYFQIPGLLIKSFVMIAGAVLMIPLSGAVIGYYGAPLQVCVLIESINLLMVAFALGQFASNRSITR